MGAGAAEGAVVACQGHGDEADGYGAGFGCSVGGRGVLAVVDFCRGYAGRAGQESGGRRKGEWDRGCSYLSLPCWLSVCGTDVVGMEGEGNGDALW